MVGSIMLKQEHLLINTYLICTMEIKFVKTVSKGSKFNQIYVPKNMENLIEAGDEVEIRLIKKHIKLYYSNGLKNLSVFKESLIRGIFSFLNGNFDINAIFIVGSFLTEKISYNDIDIVIITSEKNENLEESVYNKLIEKFDLKFHILAIKEKRFWRLSGICPLTRAMFSNFICNKPIKIPDKKFADKNHIKFLLMMPHDLLEIKLNSRSFFDSVRRLITIERFLKDRSLDIATINEEIKKLVKEQLYKRIKNNDDIEENSFNFLRKIIRTKLKIIEDLIKNGQE